MSFASWRGSIRFGPLVQFPVKAVAVDRETKFAYNLHHAEDGGRLHNGESVCEACGKEVPRDAMVKGYKGVAGVDEDYLKSLQREKSSVLELDGIVPAAQIEPRMFARSYDLIADEGGTSVYRLFHDALVDAGRVAIGRLTTSGRDQIVAIRPRGKTLEMNTLWWPDEVRQSSEAEAAIANEAEPDPKLLGMAGALVKMMAKDFDPSAYKNEQAEQTAEYLEAFLAGKEPVRIAATAKPSSPAMSLEEAMASSLAALGGTAPAKKSKKAKAA